tara:strand:- start:1896 stop:2600 length:705 start_codon:yes stop_codon:yes gene_type:complete
MICAIMQPHYFPWSGYFSLINKSQIFVFLDDSQFSKASWHNRNIILANKKKKWITVPTKKSKLATIISEKLIDHSFNWNLPQARTILQTYSKHPFIRDISELMDYFLELKPENLSSLNIDIIRFISKKINLNTNFLLSSEFGFSSKRTKKIVDILNVICATEYLSPEGSKNYLEEDNFKELSNIKLSFNNYIPKEYPQKFLNKFVGNLSIIDVIANLGWKNAEMYVKGNLDFYN